MLWASVLAFAGRLKREAGADTLSKAGAAPQRYGKRTRSWHWATAWEATVSRRRTASCPEPEDLPTAARRTPRGDRPGSPRGRAVGVAPRGLPLRPPRVAAAWHGARCWPVRRLPARRAPLDEPSLGPRDTSVAACGFRARGGVVALSAPHRGARRWPSAPPCAALRGRGRQPCAHAPEPRHDCIHVQ